MESTEAANLEAEGSGISYEWPILNPKQSCDRLSRRRSMKVVHQLPTRKLVWFHVNVKAHCRIIGIALISGSVTER